MHVVQSPTQDVVPNLIGGWPPALDDCSDNGLYEASMLLLFNPWQDLRKLKNGHNTFGSMFTEFEMVMSDTVRERIDNIQSYHDCKWDQRGSDILFD